MNVFLSTELHSFLQTLLDLLQRADDYIRDKVDLTFLTQTLPQLVENVYSSAHVPRRRRNALETGRAIKMKCTANKGSREDIQCFPGCKIFQDITLIILHIVILTNILFSKSR